MVDYDDLIIPIVIDAGSDTCRVGFAAKFAGESKPILAVIPTVVGRWRVGFLDICGGGLHLKDCYVGDEALEKQAQLFLNFRLKRPIERGLIMGWDDMEEIWKHIFYSELRVAPEEHPILLTEPPLNPKANRERIVQTMFETFDVPGLYIANQSVLSLLGSPRSLGSRPSDRGEGVTVGDSMSSESESDRSDWSLTGVVLDSGHYITQSIPIFQGFPIFHAIRSLNIAGRQLDNFLVDMLEDGGYVFYNAGVPSWSNPSVQPPRIDMQPPRTNTQPARINTQPARVNTQPPRVDMQIIREAKETLTYCAQDFDVELKVSDENPDALSRKLPRSDHFSSTSEMSGASPATTSCDPITINGERFTCAEALFQPHLMSNSFSTSQKASHSTSNTSRSWENMRAFKSDSDAEAFKALKNVSGDFAGITKSVSESGSNDMKDEGGIHELIFESILKCDVDFRVDLFANIVLAGGTTMIPGLGERLEKELGDLVRAKQKLHVTPADVEVVASSWEGIEGGDCGSKYSGEADSGVEVNAGGPDEGRGKCSGEAVREARVERGKRAGGSERIRRYSSWIGGSRMAKDMLERELVDDGRCEWITSNEYDDHGPATVHMKCC